MDYDTGRWSEVLSSTVKNDQKENLVDYMDTQAQAQQYIENTVGSYYQMIKKSTIYSPVYGWNDTERNQCHCRCE